MIEVDPRVRSSLWGLFGIVLGAGWVAYGLVGNGSRAFLTILVVSSIVLVGVATFVLRSRPRT
jgi:hypothetical protein